MRYLSNHSFIRWIIYISALILSVKIVWFIVEMTLLSARGVEYMQSSQIKSLYYRTHFASQKIEQKRVISKPMSDINSFKLLAIYHSDDTIVITISKGAKHSILTKGDMIDGYRLVDGTATEAIFLRNGKNYRLKLIKSKGDLGGQKSVRYIPRINKVSPPPIQKREEVTKGEIVQGDDVTIIDKSILEHYGRNMNDIWKNIGIKEVKDGRDIKGFKVNFVKRGSDFSKLGLRRGDIIKSVNGQELNSYNSAFEIYKNMDSIESLTLTIKRGNEEMELNYEIN